MGYHTTQFSPPPLNKKKIESRVKRRILRSKLQKCHCIVQLLKILNFDHNLFTQIPPCTALQQLQHDDANAAILGGDFIFGATKIYCQPPKLAIRRLSAAGMLSEGRT